MAWRPQVGPQLDAILASWCPLLFYGGARGGGKSDYLLGDYAQDVVTYGRHWQGIVFRKTYKQLEELVRRAKELYLPSGATYRKGEALFEWPNGARLKLRHLSCLADTDEYQGHQYPWIGYDEVTNLDDIEIVTRLFACNRWGEMALPTKRIRLAGNPGGALHHALKAAFIDPAPTGYMPLDIPVTVLSASGQEVEINRERMFIPSKVQNNKILLQNDPDYIKNLQSSGSPELVRAWLEGDWNVTLGAFFPEFGSHLIVQPFRIPKHWTRFRAIDWGFGAPMCCLWIAVSDGELSDVGIPRGALVVYRELYGTRMYQDEQVERIKELSDGERIIYTVADPGMKGTKQDMRSSETVWEYYETNGISLAPAGNARVSGWQQVRMRLQNKMLFFFSTCTNTIRTLPLLQHDAKDPEDCDTDGEDHAPDALRYGCQSRPFVRNYTEPQDLTERLLADKSLGRGLSLDELYKLEEQRQRRRYML